MRHDAALGSYRPVSHSERSSTSPMSQLARRLRQPILVLLCASYCGVDHSGQETAHCLKALIIDSQHSADCRLGTIYRVNPHSTCERIMTGCWDNRLRTESVGHCFGVYAAGSCARGEELLLSWQCGLLRSAASLPFGQVPLLGWTGRRFKAGNAEAVCRMQPRRCQGTRCCMSVWAGLTGLLNT